MLVERGVHRHQRTFDLRRTGRIPLSHSAISKRRPPRKTIGVALTALLLVLGLIAPAAAAQDQSGEQVTSDPQARDVDWTKDQACSAANLEDDYGAKAGNPAPAEGEWTYHFILTDADSWGDIAVSGSPTISTRVTGGALHIYFNLEKNGTPSVTVHDVVPRMTGGGEANVVLTLSHCVDGADEAPVTVDVELVKVWTVATDPDGLFVESAASATLAADTDTGLSHGDTYTVTESDVDTGHTSCTVTDTAGLGEQTVDTGDAVDGIITHQVTNTVTCEGADTGGTGGQTEEDTETEVGGEVEVTEPETEVRGEIEVALPEPETPMTDRTLLPQPPVSERALEAVPVTEVLAEVQERQLPRTGAPTQLLLILGMLGVGLGTMVLRRRTEGVVS